MSGKPPRQIVPESGDQKTDKISLSHEDLTALDEFCKSVDLEELDAAAWQKLRDSLDLTIPVFLSAVEARSGTRKQLTFSRAVWQQDSSESVRQRAACEVIVPPGTGDGELIILEGLGDRRVDCCGNLKVIIRIKSPS